MIAQCINPGCKGTQVIDVLRRQDQYCNNGTNETYVYTFVYCKSCRVGFVNPFPAADVLRAFYGSDYTYHAETSRRGFVQNMKIAFASLRYRNVVVPGFLSILSQSLACIIEALARHTISYSLGIPAALPKNARILDYGCGSGEWLLRMQDCGYSNLFGWDMSANTKNIKRLNDSGITATTDDPLTKYEQNSFDCIRLEHVFEHLLDPIEVLSNLKRLLKTAGMLVMTFPSIYPWEPVQKIPGSPHIAHMQMPIHLVHHSKQSAVAFLEHAGYTVKGLRIVKRWQYITVLAVQASGRMRLNQSYGFE